MASKTLLCVVAQVLLVQSISAYYAGSPYKADAYATERYASDRINADRHGADRLAADAIATSRYAGNRVSADAFADSPFSGHIGGAYGDIRRGYSHGAALPIASVSPISPNGVSVYSENAIEGALAVTGQLPFLGSVALEGALPTAGFGAVNFGAGNGRVGILKEDAAGYVYDPMTYGYGHGLGYGGRY